MDIGTLKHAYSDLKQFGIKYFIFYSLGKMGLNGGEIAEKIRYDQYKTLDHEGIKRELTKLYERATGQILDWSDLRTYNEKIQWLKLYDKNPLKTTLADKYLVRDWVKEKIGEKYLIPLLGVWDDANDIDFDILPNRFVLKANHGCGWNIIIKDKDKIDKNEVRERLNKWLSLDFAYMAKFEMHYSQIRPRVIAEEYIENIDGDIYDYKFWCFNGNVEFIMFLFDRAKGLKMVNLDKTWHKLPFVYNYPMAVYVPPKPDNLEEMIFLAETLSKGFQHVRVDLYRLNDGTIKFGEMTFTSATGFQKWSPDDINTYLGGLIKLK